MSNERMIKIDRELLKSLYRYFESKLTHPHGVDEFETRKKSREGKKGIQSTRVHVTHTHKSNIMDNHEHRWFHKLGKLLKLHTYELIESDR